MKAKEKLLLTVDKIASWFGCMSSSGAETYLRFTAVDNTLSPIAVTRCFQSWIFLLHPLLVIRSIDGLDFGICHREKKNVTV
jgi:hypothetical protein